MNFINLAIFYKYLSNSFLQRVGYNNNTLQIVHTDMTPPTLPPKPPTPFTLSLLIMVIHISRNILYHSHTSFSHSFNLTFKVKHSWLVFAHFDHLLHDCPHCTYSCDPVKRALSFMMASKVYSLVIWVDVVVIRTDSSKLRTWTSETYKRQTIRFCFHEQKNYFTPTGDKKGSSVGESKKKNENRFLQLQRWTIATLLQPWRDFLSLSHKSKMSWQTPFSVNNDDFQPWFLYVNLTVCMSIRIS